MNTILKKGPIHLFKSYISNGFQVYMCNIFIKIWNSCILVSSLLVIILTVNESTRETF